MRSAAAITAWPARSLPGWAPAAILIAATALAGPQLGGAARPLFLLGSLAAGWYAWRCSPGAHLQAVLALFSFAPFLRRIVDLSAGFDPGGLMVAAPLLALLAPLPELRELTVPGRPPVKGLAPLFVFAACVLYCVLLTVSQGEMAQAASNGIKWFAPVTYAAALYRRAREAPQILDDAASAFLVILPITGLYGLYQYIDPPTWDRYWLVNASITSAGLPAPFEVRTFSTEHAPAAFATFTAAGLLLVYVLRNSWLARLAMAPAVLALALSLYRTAWMSLAAGFLFCLLMPATRGRAGGAIALLAGAIVAALAFTPFGDVLADRFATFGNASNDGSGQERLAEFAYLWSLPGGGLFGIGFQSVDTGSAGAVPVDGMFAVCWSCMGIVAGLICLGVLFYTIAAATAPAFRNGSRESVVLGALGFGWLVQLPLACIASGELGFLFWTTTALAISMPQARARP
jgi:hypothetical protein